MTDIRTVDEELVRKLHGIADMLPTSPAEDLNEAATRIEQLHKDREEGRRNVYRLQSGGVRLCNALRQVADEGRQSADTYGCANCNAHAELAKAALNHKEPDPDWPTVEQLHKEVERLTEALDRIADVWTLQAKVQPDGRKWHCQHEEWLSASVETARAALTGEPSLPGGLS